VNVLSASIAFAGPTGGVVSSGTASISTAGTTTTINQSTSKAAIDWSSFSTNSNEIVNFVQPNSSSITLNRVTGTSASTLNGQLNANGQVFIINPNGVLFGSTSQVNTAGLVASTLNLSNSDFNNNLFNFSNTSNNKVVENRGKITVPTGGTVALIAPTIKQTGTIKAPQGNVLLAAGGDITLNLNNGSLLGYTINQGKAQALINSGGMIQADGGKVVLTAKGIDELSNAVVNSVGMIQAQTVNNVRGVIELGSDLTSGTLNVGGTLDASALMVVMVGKLKLLRQRYISILVPISQRSVIVQQLTADHERLGVKSQKYRCRFLWWDCDWYTLGDALNKGNVTLNAIGTAEGQGNINVNDATSWNANTALTLTANKDINFNSDLDLSGDKAKLAMNYGVGADYNLNNGAKINISGSSPTLLINGTSYIVINNLGEEGDANINTLQGMNNNLSGNYVLGSDIDASDTVNWNGGKGFDPIGQLPIVTIWNDPNNPGGKLQPTIINLLREISWLGSYD
jgi:filamentous hemagglutinin family protein